MQAARTATAFTVVVALLISAFPSAAAIPAEPTTRDLQLARDETCNHNLGPLPPPPNPKKDPAPSLSGRTDLAVPFTEGVIRVRIRCGRSIDDIKRKYDLKGEASFWSPPPFDEHDRRAGLDRSYRITVRSGEEKAVVQRLWRFVDDFAWVQLDWQFAVGVTGKPAGAAPRPLALTPNDPYLASQTNLTRANFARAWDRTVSCGAGACGPVIVSVIDSGLRATHNDAGLWKQYKGYDYVRGIETPPGQAIDSGCAGGHGTHVGTIAAGDTNNGFGIAGAGFNTGILPMRALSGTSGDCNVWHSQTRDWPIRWSRLEGAHIVNMSYFFGGPDPDEEKVMAETWAAGATPVAAAANFERNIDEYPLYPCAYKYVLCVTANRDDGLRCSSVGFGINSVDYSAPSQNAYGAGSATDTAIIYDSCKTSYAVPLVSGALALLRSLGYGPDAQHQKLSQTPKKNSFTAFGEIDAGDALWR